MGGGGGGRGESRGGGGTVSVGKMSKFLAAGFFKRFGGRREIQGR